MSVPPLPLIKGALWIDNSRFIEPLTTCTSKLEKGFLLGRQSIRENAALNYGAAIHHALELRYQRYGTTPPDDSYTQDVTQLLTNYFAEHPSEMGESRNLQWALETVAHYNAKFPEEDFKLLCYKEPQPCSHCNGSGDNIPTGELGTAPYCMWCFGSGTQKHMVELPFALPLYTWEGWLKLTSFTSTDYEAHVIDRDQEAQQVKIRLPIFYCGKIDLPLKRGQQLFVGDHKTTGSLGKMFWTEKRLASQQRGYAHAFQEITGIKVDGYMINAIRTEQIPDYVREGRPFRGKAKSIPQWWDESLQREYFLLGEGDLEEWKQDTIELVERFFFHYTRGHFPMEKTGCSKYGLCQYNEICSLYPPSERPFALNNEAVFQDSTWSPLNSTE